jgi:hypothetical protein
MVRASRLGPALVLLAAFGIVQAQEATVRYRDRVAKKDGVETSGTIVEENLLGVKIQSGKAKDTKFIPAADIERITYKTKDVDPITYRTPFLREVSAGERTKDIEKLKDPTGTDEKARVKLEATRSGLLNEAKEGYAKLEKEVRSPPAARRYFQYKQAEIAVTQARYDPAATDAAVKALIDFKSNNREGWELIFALETLARLQEDAGKVDDARKSYEELAELPGAPDSVKQQSGLLVGKLLLRGKKYKEAEDRLGKVVAAMSAGDAQKPLAQAYLIASQIGLGQTKETEKKIADLLGGTSDPRVRSVAYALRGDYFLEKGQQNEAFWNYLRVDAQYNEDPEAHARALYHLATLFDTVKKDPIRGKDCLTRLLDKRFEGSPYQKLAQEAAKKE